MTIDRGSLKQLSRLSNYDLKNDDNLNVLSNGQPVESRTEKKNKSIGSPSFRGSQKKFSCALSVEGSALGKES